MQENAEAYTNNATADIVLESNAYCLYKKKKQDSYAEIHCPACHRIA